MPSLALLLDDVLELLLALPGDDIRLGRSNNEEISTVATDAGLMASSHYSRLSAVEMWRRRWSSEGLLKLETAMSVATISAFSLASCTSQVG